MRVVVPPTRRFQGKVKALPSRSTRATSRGLEELVDPDRVGQDALQPVQADQVRRQPQLLPADGVAVLTEAIFRIEMASGLRYKYDGTTNAIPFRTTPGKERDKKANLSVAWSTPDTDAANLGGLVLARGGFNGTQVRPASQDLRADQDRPADGRERRLRGPRLRQRRRPRRGAHARAGARGRLGHTNDPSQIMYPVVDASAALYGKGDITGLCEARPGRGLPEPKRQRARRTGGRCLPPRDECPVRPWPGALTRPTADDRHLARAPEICTSGARGAS